MAVGKFSMLELIKVLTMLAEIEERILLETEGRVANEKWRVSSV